MDSTHKPTIQQLQHSAIQPSREETDQQRAALLQTSYSTLIKTVKLSNNTFAALIPNTRQLLALCMLPQISRGKKTRQFSSHQQSALLSLIFGRSSSAATWTALTNHQFSNSNTRPFNLLGKNRPAAPNVLFKSHQARKAVQQYLAALIPKTRQLLALCLLQISRGKKTRQFSSHQQSALLSLIFGRSSSAATWTALTNQQFSNSNTQPFNLVGKKPTSSEQPCSKRPIQLSSSP